MDVYNPVYPGLYYFDTFTFTTLGTSGHRGPDTTKMYANAPWSADQFSIVDGQQQWTVPATGTYHIEAAGAYATTPGRVVSGDVNLNEGQTLSLLLGQQPTPLTANVVDATTVGGGGGTFIESNGTLLMVASGGDGTGGHAASFSPYGSGNGKNGGGYFSNGLATNATFKFLKPEAYVNGGFGNSFPTGVVPEEGGFGGGQSPVTSGVSGGGGYTGSPGNGTTGATCYADSTVRNFTDIGAASNSAGYVSVSLIDPTPPIKMWTWDPTQQWTVTNAVASGLNKPVWSSSLGLFVVSANFQKILTSTDGIMWSAIQSNLPSLPRYYNSYVLVSSANGVLLAVSSDSGYVYRSIDASTWTLSLSSSINGAYSVFINRLFILKGNDNATMYTSPDGITWTIITPNLIFNSITYGNSKYMMTDGTMYTSTDLTTWSPVLDSNLTTSVNGWSSVLFDNQTFVSVKSRFALEIRFYTQNTNMSPRPQIMINNPIYNITSLTFTGSWDQGSAQIGDTINFASISNFAYTVSPATYGTVTASSSGSVTISFVSSTITAQSSFQNNLTLNFTRTGGTNYGMVTSSDGINWYGRTTPAYDYWSWSTLISGGDSFMALDPYSGGSVIYSIDKGVTWSLSVGSKGAKYGVYSPTLEYFLLTDGNIFYISPDGSIIVPAISGGTTGNPVQLVWADTLGILVAISAYSIVTSNDGITWTLVLNLKPDGSGSNERGSTISWSRELGILVAYFDNSNTSNSPLAYTSKDGVTWSQTDLPDAFPLIFTKPCWSPQIGLFTTGKAISRDGINWVFDSNTSAPALICAAWSPSLKLFVGTDELKSYYSIDGVVWYISGSNYMTSIAWSPTLNLFVGVGSQEQSRPPFMIKTSSTGTSWTQVYSESSQYVFGASIAWSSELNVFVCMYQGIIFGNEGVRVLTSSDGVSWTSLGSNTVQSFTSGDIVWSPELKIFLFTSDASQTGMFKSIPASKTT